MCILLDLCTCLAYGDAGLLQFDMYDWHAVDEEHKIAPTVACQRMWSVELRLFSYLIATAATGDLFAVVELEGHFLAEMSLVIGIVAFDGNGFTVDECIQLYRSTAGINLFDYLVHLSSGERVVAKTVDSTIVVKEDVGPVCNQVGLSLVLRM